MNYFVLMLEATWQLTRQMAPSLLVGFLIAGLLSALISPATVQRHLGRRGFAQTLKAALFGVPMPLCSCSVVPVAASFYRHGAGKGATLSFLASTPQTSVNSLAVTWSLLGPLFVFFRVLVAFISGILAGVGIDWLDRRHPEFKSNDALPGEPSEQRSSPRWKRALRHGFVTLPSDIGPAMFVGLFVGGALTVFLPDDYLGGALGKGFGSMVVMMLVGIPLYICSSASVPVAYGFIRGGISPGAALVFLVTGPATNAATISAVYGLVGRRGVVVYLAAIAVSAFFAGITLDAVVSHYSLPTSALGHDCARHSPVSSALGALLFVVLLLPIVKNLSRSLCHREA